jgi:hypothetical protein
MIVLMNRYGSNKAHSVRKPGAKSQTNDLTVLWDI